MRSSLFYVVVVSGALVVWCPFCLAARPNILVVVADDHAATAVDGRLGLSSRTPTLSALRASGVSFSRCFVTLSLCTPSRLSMLTGRYAHEHLGSSLNDGNGRELATYPEALAASGYRTGLFGKWHVGGRPPFQNFTIFWKQGKYFEPKVLRESQWSPQGDPWRKVLKEEAGVWSAKLVADEAADFATARGDRPWLVHAHFKETHETWLYPSKFDDIILSPAEEDLLAPPETLEYSRSSEKEEERLHGGWPLGYLGDRMLRQKYGTRKATASDLLPPLLPLKKKERCLHFGKNNNNNNNKQKDEKQVFFSVAATVAETTCPDVRRYLLRAVYDKYVRDYLRTASAMDEAVGDLLSRIDLRDDDVVVYTSDNGLFLGEHGYFDKRFAYEPSVRVPCVVRYPKEIPGGLVVKDHLALNVDWAPTFLDLAGISADDAMRSTHPQVAPALRGRSLRPYWQQLLQEGRHRSSPKAEAEAKNGLSLGVKKVSDDDDDDDERRRRRKRDFVYYRYYSTLALRPTSPRPSHVAVRTADGKKLIFFDGLQCVHRSPFELYDLEEDPDESTNLYSRNHTLAAQLRHVLVSAMRDAGDVLRGTVKGDHLPASCSLLTDDCLDLIAERHDRMANATTLRDVPEPLRSCRPDLQPPPSPASKGRGGPTKKKRPPPAFRLPPKRHPPP